MVGDQVWGGSAVFGGDDIAATRRKIIRSRRHSKQRHDMTNRERYMTGGDP